MKFPRFAPLLLGIAMTPAIAMAQSSSGPAAVQTAIAPGTVVYDPQGAEVGTIENVADGNVVVNTGTNRATLAANAFASGAKGPVLNTTRAQLDAAVADAAAKAGAATRTALIPDAEVRDKDGAVVGKIKSVEGANVVLQLASGPVSVPNQYFTTDSNGLALTITAAELINAAKTATASAAAPSDAKSK
ncbi:MAG TPA: hypothetical protein VGE05_04265 [Novosphingobium sp.]